MPETDEFLYGGQAVIEGVMMRGPGRMAVSVRTPQDEILTHVSEFTAVGEKYPVLAWPFVRGVVALYDSLRLGIEALLFSAEASGEEEEELSQGELAVTLAISFGLAILLFVLAPTYAVNFVKPLVPNTIALNLIEGALRVTVLLVYVALIARADDVARVLQYHGAEHKVIHSYEAGEPLDVQHVRPYTTLHPRCGTSFLMFVAIVSIILYAFFGWPGLLERLAIRLALLPVVAGIAYELIRLAGRSKSPLLSWIAWPGLVLQRLTTREPADDQIEVALAAFAAARTGVAGNQGPATTGVEQHVD